MTSMQQPQRSPELSIGVSRSLHISRGSQSLSLRTMSLRISISGCLIDRLQLDLSTLEVKLPLCLRETPDLYQRARFQFEE